MSLSIQQALAAASRLTSVSDTPALDIQLLLEHVLQQPRAYLYTWPERSLTADQERHFQALLARREAGEPVAHILGFRDFWTLSLEVDASTLIPRPETELLVELALELLDEAPARVVDLGTGSGAIALALASERPRWQLVGVERVPEAAALAERNRQRLGLANAQILSGSWCDPLSGQFKMIVSNPPYIDPDDPHLQQGDVRFEPRSALVAMEQGMADIRHIACQALDCLEPGGWLLLEHGYDQGPAVRRCLCELGYQHVATRQDLEGRDRVTLGCLGRQLESKG